MPCLIDRRGVLAKIPGKFCQSRVSWAARACRHRGPTGDGAGRKTSPGRRVGGEQGVAPGWGCISSLPAELGESTWLLRSVILSERARSGARHSGAPGSVYAPRFENSSSCGQGCSISVQTISFPEECPQGLVCTQQTPSCVQTLPPCPGSLSLSPCPDPTCIFYACV